MKRLFAHKTWNWGAVLLFALLAGVYTGAVMLISPLHNTSFQDIGISYECWVVFAVLIVTHGRTWWDAMLKCFVFFLISQPLVYAVEVAFGSLPLTLAWQYYRQMWLPMTILTLPGGAIAYLCKKQNWLGAVVLGLGNAIECLMGVTYVITAFSDFPHHLLTAIFCVCAIFGMTFMVQKEAKYRLIALVLPLVLTAAVIAIAKAMGLFLVSGIY